MLGKIFSNVRVGLLLMIGGAAMLSDNCGCNTTYSAGKKPAGKDQFTMENVRFKVKQYFFPPIASRLFAKDTQKLS